MTVLKPGSLMEKNICVPQNRDMTFQLPLFSLRCKQIGRYFCQSLYIFYNSHQEDFSSQLPLRKELGLLTLNLYKTGDMNNRNEFSAAITFAAALQGDVPQLLGEEARFDTTTLGAFSDVDS